MQEIKDWIKYSICTHSDAPEEFKCTDIFQILYLPNDFPFPFIILSPWEHCFSLLMSLTGTKKVDANFKY